MSSRAEEVFKTVMQWVAIALLALICGIILHKGYVDFSALAQQHSGEGFWRALARYFLRNLAG